MSKLEQSAAFAVTPGPENWVQVFRFVIRLLRGGNRILVTTEANEGGGLPLGSFVIPASQSFDLSTSGDVSRDAINSAATRADIELRSIDSNTSFVAKPVQLTRVGLYGGGGAPFNHAGILATCGFPVEFLSAADVREGGLSRVDVFVMPGGGERAMFGQIEPLGDAGCLAIAEFVRRGGMYIGCCAGSYDCIINTEEFLGACPAQRCLQLVNAGPWRGERTVGFLGLESPGVGVIRVRNERADHPVMWGMPDEFEIVHYNGPVLDPDVPPVVDGASAAAGLASFLGPTKSFTPAEQFAGQPTPNEPTYLDQAAMAGRFSIVAGELGLGRIVAFGSHPEFGFDLAMAAWGDPARMFANAVFWQAASTSQAPDRNLAARDATRSFPVGSSLLEVQSASDALIETTRLLTDRSIEPRPSWLAPSYSMSVFGLPPDEVWRKSLTQMVDLAEETARIAGELQHKVRTATRSQQLLDALELIDRWALDDTAPEWNQDGGYVGVRALLRVADHKCREAIARWDVELGPPGGPYDYFNENPYHLVAGSYLAAIGCVAGAVQLMRGLDAEWRMAEELSAERSLSSATATGT